MGGFQGKLQNKGKFMSSWMIYAIAASAAYGLSAIPLKYAVNRNNLSAPSELVLLSSCAGAFIGAFLHLIFSGKTFPLMTVNKDAMLLSGLSGIIGVAGSLAVIKPIRFFAVLLVQPLDAS